MKKWLMAAVAMVALAGAACGGDDGGSGGGEGGGGPTGGKCDTEAMAACIDSGQVDGEAGPCNAAWDAYLECLGESCAQSAHDDFIACVQAECPETMPCYED